MNILILSWRDPRNPKSGGAEMVMLKYALHWTKSGHKVFWLGSRYDNLSVIENIGGLNIHRVGPELQFYNTWTMLLTYPVFLLNSIWIGWGIARHQNINLVIDAIHGLPLFSPFYVKCRKVLWVCEVAGTIWDKMYPFPINWIGKVLEKLVYFIYQNSEIWAISESTKNDILKINPKLHVKIVPLGIDIKRFSPIKKFGFPSALFVARLVKMKGIESAIKAAREIRKKFNNFVLYVIGDGDSDYIKSLNAPSCVIFLGRLSDKDRNKYLSRCHFLIHPSFKEGFGLTVLEAAASGTPTIARRGSSMDELINDGNDGLLFDSDKQISNLYLKYFDNTKYKALTSNAFKSSHKYNWIQILSNSRKITQI